jgi:hypothetical protein
MVCLGELNITSNYLQKTTLIKICDIMPISAKSPKYRLVDVTPTLVKIQIF